VLLIAAWEWSGFLSRPTAAARVGFVVLFTVLLGALLYALSKGWQSDLFFYLAALWWGAVTAWLVVGSGKASRSLAAPVGLLCLLPASLALLQVVDTANGAVLLVWVVLIVAAADIGAYFTGRSIGRNKLAPHISPGKTREGLYGGLVSAALVGAAGAAYFGLSVTGWLLAAILMALASVSGDLLVSAFKRSAGLKDSGKILPGHGGVMDRVDGLHAALPIFVLSLEFLGTNGSNIPALG